MTERVLMRVIDLETAGLEPPASVIEIGYTDVLFDPDTKRAEIGGTINALFRPTEALAPENIAVHHLTPRMLDPFPACTDDDLKSAAESNSPFILVAANCAFERKWFTDELIGSRHWICTVKAAARLHPDAASHANQAMRYHLGLYDLPEHMAMPPHRAGPDSYVTAHILAVFLETTPVRDLVRWTSEPKHLPRAPFGKHKGQPWPEVPIDYLHWAIKQTAMDADAMHAVQLEMTRRAAATSATEQKAGASA